MANDTVVVWFRQDLRLSDLPSLEAANKRGAKVIALYIHDVDSPLRRFGGASRWWLHHSLRSLGDAMEALGGRLVLRSGPADEVLSSICSETGASAVHCSRRYEPGQGELEQRLHDRLDAEGVQFRRYPGTLLHEPGSIVTGDGNAYRVFTPFWRACRRVAVVQPAEASKTRWHSPVDSEDLDSWRLTPDGPNWAAGWEDTWSPGERGAHERLESFLDSAVDRYNRERDLPAVEGTSRLSAHLHHGEISPRQVWARTTAHLHAHGAATQGIEKFQAELGWREFSYHLLHFFPHIIDAPFNGRFAVFPWVNNDTHLKAWQRGLTGYPIVDAGMRELWRTGYMHNRVRMIVASFLCKHLRIDWRAGERWFWDTLVDADLASNSCSWQWVAGSGADAAPYFRIFNPMLQGQKFDKDGAYVRRWIPEIAALPDKYIHEPWEAPAETLTQAGVSLGRDYPEPIVDHRAARQAALGAYDAVKNSPPTA